MLAKVAVFVFAAVLAVNAGILDGMNGISADTGNFFTKSFKGVNDLFASDFKGLETNIERVKELLIGVKDKMKFLEPLANDAQKETLKNVDGFLNKITNFQADVTEQGQEKFEQNKSTWQNLVSDIFNKGGLQSVVGLLKTNSAPSYSYAAILTPVLYMIFVR